MKFSLPLALAFSAASFFALGGCSNSDVPKSAAGEVGTMAPPWKLKDYQGKDVNSYALKGKVVVVDFWATWCPPCREEIPGYVSLQQKYEKEGLVVVGMSVDRAGVGVVKDFVNKMGVNYPVVMADDATVAAFGGTEMIPTTFIVDRDGKISHKKTGYVETAEFEKLLLPLLK